MKKSQNHFVDKKEHTGIKHKLFYDTFNAVLGISAKFSKNNNFVYIDLYAGQGKFDDNSLGSPMLALNTIIESDFKITSEFHEIKCFFSEKDEHNYNILEEGISAQLKSKKVANLKTHISRAPWNNNDTTLNEYLKYTKWGFIFIDPFSNEIDLDSLFELLENRARRIDIMLFINTQSLKRIAGMDNNNEAVAKFLGVEEHILIQIINDNQLIRECLQNRFSSVGKDYILNASIPTTREGELINSDTFQLLLLTNSIGVSDTFLNSYCNAIESFKGNCELLLFNPLEDSILSIVRNRKSITIQDLIQELYKNNNSWKEVNKNYLPTSDNLYTIINKLLKEKYIFFVSPAEFRSKKTDLIIKKAYNRNEYMKQVRLISK